ncbi:hypothetical protein CAPTEDRAFT_138820 [Capitella teleta]|uniref:Magnesium transporter NIPA2 n=1 Tax=Capitella teleta TaxID=283909 RepID=R7VF31_CAPTE|nr:hypothetical protein CAPTEDRAFT_138820 [Capitella teleta]|eukprot:ELU14921.1 hypothetical protein CAPTEDRAFT_138820 [Capitella teleta]
MALLIQPTIAPDSTWAPDVPLTHTFDFYIGLILAISSCLFIGSSFIVKKKGLRKVAFRAGQYGGHGYLKEQLWWAGMVLMAVGETCNFAAYAYAPATLVTPLGAISILVSAVLASHFLNERLNILGKIGCLLCLIGAVIVIIHSPKDAELGTLEEIFKQYLNPFFITYAVLVFVSGIILIFYAAPRWGTTHPMVFVTITGTFGSLSVMGCKGMGEGLRETFNGQNQFLNWEFYVLLVFVALCITLQINYMNKALDIFNTSVVTPLLYVVFTLCVIIASQILIGEWVDLAPLDIMGNCCGLFVIAAGIFLLQMFNELDISLKDLPKLRKKNLGSDFTQITVDNEREALLSRRSI